MLFRFRYFNNAGKGITGMGIVDILVADNDIQTLESICSYFNGTYNLLLPPSIDALRKEPFLNSSLAILDSSFSKNKGLEALKVLKALKPSQPVFFTTDQSIVEELCKSIKHILPTVNGRETERPRENVLIDKYTEDFGSGKKEIKGTRNLGKISCVDNVIKYIEENYNQNISLGSLASVAFMSKYHFSRTFKEMTGISANKYLNVVRIREAKWFLRSKNLSVSQVSFKVGYNGITYFDRVFKNMVGCNPSDYKKKAGSL